MVSGLKKGDTIGVFSPSRPITAEAPEAVKKAVRFLEKNGYYVKMGRLTGRSDWYRSGSVEERADELNELIHDDSVTCLMASMGDMYPDLFYRISIIHILGSTPNLL